MTVAEATRQYQAELERARAAHTAADHLLSMEDELAFIDADLEKAKAHLDLVWFEECYG